MDEPDFDQYQGLFLECTDNPQNQELIQNFMELKSSLLEKPEQYFAYFIEFNIKILGNKEIPEKSKIQAAIFLKQGLQTYSLSNSRIYWSSIPKDIHDFALDTLFSSLSSNEVAHRNMCSECIACIAFLELDPKVSNEESRWYHFCGVLFDYINQKETDHNRFIGAISCLAAMFQYQLFQHPDIPEGINEIILFLQNILVQKTDDIMAIKDSAISLQNIIKQTPNLHSPEKIQNFIQMAYTAYQNPPPQPASQIPSFYNSILNILFELIKQNYPCFMENKPLVDNICSLIHEQISSQKGILKWYAINFLNEISEFEGQSQLTNISCLIAAQFNQDLLQCLIDIEDPLNTDPEDITEIAPHMMAATTLRSLFNHNQQEIFTAVQTFYETHIESENWIEIHAAIYSLIAICDNQNDESNETIAQFFQSILPALIHYSGEETINLRMKETSLWILSRVLLSCPNIDGLFQDLFGLFIHCLDPNYLPIILSRACKLFFNLAKKCNKNSIDDCFDQTSETIFHLVQSFDFSTINPPEVIEPLSLALNSLINESTSPASDENVKLLLDNLFDLISNPLIASSLLISIAYAFSRIPVLIKPEIIGYTLKLLYVISPTLGASHELKSCAFIDQQFDDSQLFQEIMTITIQSEFQEFDIDIWECALIALCGLLSSDCRGLQYLSFPLFSTMCNALQIENANLTRTAIKGISKLFQTIPPEISKNYLEYVLMKINEIYDQLCGYSSFKLTLLYLYGSIFKHLGSVFININENKNAQEMVERVNQIASTVFNTSLSVEINEINHMLFFAYFGLFKGFSKHHEFLVNITRQRVLPLIEAIYNNGVFDLKVLSAAFELIKAIGEILTYRVNVDLNRKYVKRLIRKGLENEELHDSAEKLLNFLENNI